LARLACGENRFIDPEAEPDYLRHTPVEKLLAEDLCDRLKRFSVFMVAELLALPRHFWERHLQIPAAHMEPLLRRGETGVRALFPPPRITATVEWDWADEGQMLAAVESVSAEIAAKLRVAGMQAQELKLQFVTRERQWSQHLHLSKALVETAPLANLLLEQILAYDLRFLKRISLSCERLLPRAFLQADLWQDRMTHEKERLAITRARLTRKFGQRAVQSGNEYAQTVPPRFAQLVWKQRGQYLP
jgi:hypothetical protein